MTFSVSIQIDTQTFLFQAWRWDVAFSIRNYILQGLCGRGSWKSWCAFPCGFSSWDVLCKDFRLWDLWGYWMDAQRKRVLGEYSLVMSHYCNMQSCLMGHCNCWLLYSGVPDSRKLTTNQRSQGEIPRSLTSRQKDHRIIRAHHGAGVKHPRTQETVSKSSRSRIPVTCSDRQYRFHWCPSKEDGANWAACRKLDWLPAKQNRKSFLASFGVFSRMPDIFLEGLWR